MGTSGSLYRLQTGALLIRTYHWQRRRYCSLFFTLILPSLVFILARVLNSTLSSSTFEVIDVEQNPKGAFAPRPFNPESCLIPSDLTESLPSFNTTTSSDLIQQCSATDTPDINNPRLRPEYIVPIYSNPSIQSTIGSHDAINPENNTGILSNYSLDIFEYPPSFIDDESSEFYFKKNNYTFPLLYDHFFNQSNNSLYQLLVQQSVGNLADRLYSSRTVSQSSYSNLLSFIYDQWYIGNLVDRIYTAFSFDQLLISDSSISLSATVFYNESQPSRIDGCDVMCPLISSISNLYSSIYQNVNPGKSLQTYLRKMPNVDDNNTIQFLQLIVSILLVILTHGLFPTFLYFLVYERDTRMRDYMSSMGLPRWIYWIGTYISLFLTYLISIAIIYIVGIATRTPYFVLNSPFAIIVLFIVWGFAMTALAMFLEPFFGDPQTAQICGWILVIVINFLGGPFIGQTISDDSISNGTWAAMMLLPSFAYMRSVYYAGAFNDAGVGISVSSKIVNGIQVGMCNGNGPFCWSYGFLILDTVILLCLASYVRYIISVVESGGKLHVLFFLGFKNKVVSDKLSDNVEDEDLVDVADDVKEEERKAKEIADGMDNDGFDGIVLNGISKTFWNKRNAVHAVRKISLVAKRNEVITILGHNGAGKSTLFKCLVGEIKPSSGQAYVNGYSISGEIDQVHQHMGLAAQQDIYWPDMSTQEHLYFFGRVKGLRAKELKDEVNKALENVQLTNARKKRTRALSGGMRRRLSISIAMLGKSTFIILDEPSTGLDLLSRERLWKAIEKMRKDKAVILTTHSLEEAEVLSTRVGIMSQGHLKCIGSSEELKLRLGDGHRLILSLPKRFIGDMMNCVLDVVPGAKLDNVVGGNVEIVLSRNAEMAKVFKMLGDNKQRLCIHDWSVQQSSLEEVFLKVTRDGQKKTEDSEDEINMV